jgi:hypothetical protein
MSIEKVGPSRMFRLSGSLLIAGLLTEAVSLHWVHPLAFMGFILIGGAFLASGALLFLYTLVSLSPTPDSRGPGGN